MKIYAIIAMVLSALFGLLPIFIGMSTDQGDEICDPEFYYSSERVCVLLWDRALIFFGLYFAVAAVFFIFLLLWWQTIGSLLKRWWP
ncbi:MAG: hypothetical protein Q4G26_02900 [Paracoccus sp. (in: a-proteobacteria)]|nr:hypothetical protein [Paracoccus sp. (in: a-proteobacteria)]